MVGMGESTMQSPGGSVATEDGLPTTDPWELVKLGHQARGRRDLIAALRMFEAASDAKPDNLNILAECGNTLRAMSRFDAAAAIYRGVLERAPGHFGALVGLGQLAKQQGDRGEALQYFEAAAETDPQNPNLQAEIAHTLVQMDRRDEAELAYQNVLKGCPSHFGALVGLGHIARARRDWAQALTHFEAAQAAAPENLGASLEMATVFRELQRPDDAEAILQHLESLVDVRIDTELLQERKFEHFCLTKQLDKAAECLAGWGHHRNVPSNSVPLAAGLYGARRQWQDVLEFFRERVVEGTWAGKSGYDPILLEAVARAARHTGSYHVVLRLIDRLAEVINDPKLRDLRDQLTEELVLLRSLGLHDGTDAPAPMIGSTLRAWRLNRLRQMLGNSSATEASATIFWCTDAAFLPGAIVSIFSLMRHNLGSLRRYSLTVFCSEDVLELTAGLCDRIATAFSTRISVRTASDLAAGSGGLCTEYGVFTPGYALSEAAYYRIYAALQLLKEGVNGRVLYLDADTWVGPGLDRLIDFDMDDRPLGACLDDVSDPAIRRAALKIGVAPEAYFNSGVLLFDLKHPALAPALREAIETSVRHPNLLTFLDQCALNMAFQAKVAPLPEPFNVFVRQHTDLRSEPTDAVVTHFLARPKPWDPMYATSNCRRWIEELAALRQVVGAEWLGPLLSLQFPRRRAGTTTGANDAAALETTSSRQESIGSPP
jgi:lipopolysaccharide biosynthesis glycosyltransferase/Flp pilus assembly protein TadD